MITTKRLMLLQLARPCRSIKPKLSTASRFTRLASQYTRDTSTKAKFSFPHGFQFRPPAHGKALLATFAGGGVVLSIFLGAQSSIRPQSKAAIEQATAEDTTDSSKPAKFRLAEVKLHDANSERPWVIKGLSVYDITEWIGAHPGGEVILRAAGGSIDPYWDIFTIHKRQDVYDILEQYLIGEIDTVDLIDGKVPEEGIEDPFVGDPGRDSRLRVLTARPCNAETPGEGLAEFLTPNGLFYVRNHMWVPAVKELEHQLTIELTNGDEKSYTMQDLRKKFKHYKVTATLQCAGNRRKDMTDHAKQTNGLQWTAGAISSAEWEGVRLRDVLADAGLDLQNVPDEAQHAQFSGLEAYGASIPLTKAIDSQGDVLLAFKMNGQDLPADHGYPLRVIVPGIVAARSVKWLRKVVLSDEESPTQWQRRDYKCFGPNVGANPDWSSAKSIQETPITSAITGIHHCSPTTASSSSNLTNPASPLTLEGYAFSGGGREIIRVDISTDNGRTWEQAQLLDDYSSGSKAWCWKRWRYHGEVRRQVDNGNTNTSSTSLHKKTTILVKATDEAYNTQPESYEHIYNVRGNLATAYHSISV